MASVIAFVQAHSVVICGVLVALADFAIEMNPSWASNSIVSALLSLLKKDAGQA